MQAGVSRTAHLRLRETGWEATISPAEGWRLHTTNNNGKVPLLRLIPYGRLEFGFAICSGQGL